MTLASQRATAGPFACDGVQVEFPFEFRVEEAEHLRVYKDDLPVESGYTVRLLENGGSVVRRRRRWICRTTRRFFRRFWRERWTS